MSENLIKHFDQLIFNTFGKSCYCHEDIWPCLVE